MFSATWLICATRRCLVDGSAAFSSSRFNASRVLARPPPAGHQRVLLLKSPLTLHSNGPLIPKRPPRPPPPPPVSSDHLPSRSSENCLHIIVARVLLTEVSGLLRVFQRRHTQRRLPVSSFAPSSFSPGSPGQLCQVLRTTRGGC